jgi:acetylornithine deacetylase/succinyl-diaminopimelate desuccinylase-like protein
VEERLGVTPALDVEALLGRLVTIDSQNPDLVADSRGELELATAVAEIMVELGMKATLPETLPGRPNVVGVLPGTSDETLLLEAHLDTVPAPGHEIVVRREGRRLHGRGTCDTKASLAAMLAAVATLSGDPGPRPTVVLAGVVDEEFVMRGAERLLDQVGPVTGVVVGEPTSLRPVRAHNGFIRVRLQVHGRSAHSSRAHLGENAILGAARVVTDLDTAVGERLRGRHHHLTGPALLTPTMVRGGSAPNVVPDHCEVWLDRRLAPGEEPAAALAEIDDVLERLRVEGTDVRRDAPLISLRGVNTAADHPLVAATERAVASVTGTHHVSSGVTYSTDACFLGRSGDVPCVVLGPGSIDQAHTDDEWVDLDEVVQAVDVFAEVVRQVGDGR